MTGNPILLGSEKRQRLLLAAYADGSIYEKEPELPLMRTGLVGEGRERNGSSQHFHRALVINEKHPAFPEFRTLMRALGVRRTRPKNVTDVQFHQMDATRPLGHDAPTDFRVLVCLARARKALEAEAIEHRIVGPWPDQVKKSVARLCKIGVLKAQGNKITFAPTVPNAYSKLILKLADVHAEKNPLLQYENVGKRVKAFMSNPDGAPKLFTSDVRLRNFMALNKYGPLHVRELRRITGAYHLERDSDDLAPFGLGGLVQTWQTPRGKAAVLDPNHPAAAPLRRLFERMEEIYPVAPFVPRWPAPEPPRRKRWPPADRHALFGSELRTTILLSIGVNEWTYLNLCRKLLPGYHFVSVKHALHRMEAEGLLDASRPHKPGFNVRIMTISVAFPAREELTEVLRAYAAAWPEFRERVELAVRTLHPKTKEHLRRRKVI